MRDLSKLFASAKHSEKARREADKLADKLAKKKDASCDRIAEEVVRAADIDPKVYTDSVDRISSILRRIVDRAINPTTQRPEEKGGDNE